MQKGAEEAGKANNVTITTAAGKEDGDETTQIAPSSRPWPAVTKAS